MDHIFFRKYNNIVVFGLGLAAASVVGAIIYWMYFSEKKKAIKEVIEPNHPSVKAQQSKPTLVLFYSDSCGHCREMSQSWKSASDVLRKAGLVDVLEFEREKDVEILQKLDNITGYPDIRLYPEGFPSNNYVKYSGDRSEESLIQFAYSSPIETPV